MTLVTKASKLQLQLQKNRNFIVKHNRIFTQNRTHEQAYRATITATYGVRFEYYGCALSSMELCTMTTYKVEIRKTQQLKT